MRTGNGGVKASDNPVEAVKPENIAGAYLKLLLSQYMIDKNTQYRVRRRE
jgi:hypothetical protein